MTRLFLNAISDELSLLLSTFKFGFRPELELVPLLSRAFSVYASTDFLSVDCFDLSSFDDTLLFAVRPSEELYVYLAFSLFFEISNAPLVICSCCCRLGFDLVCSLLGIPLDSKMLT
jgi:hypothetical protein